ncbi:MAG: hypothetical protein WCD37_10230 [Chloroflexia bacterium]
MRRRRYSTFLAVFVAALVVTCLGAGILVLIASNNDDRATFEARDQAALTAFMEEYRLAEEQGEAWTKEPRDIALRFSCREECGGERVTVNLPEPDRVVLIVEDHTVFDDSIKATKTRIELARGGNGWKVEWAGWKQQCRRDDWTAVFQGRFGWHTQLCP